MGHKTLSQSINQLPLLHACFLLGCLISHLMVMYFGLMEGQIEVEMGFVLHRGHIVNVEVEVGVPQTGFCALFFIFAPMSRFRTTEDVSVCWYHFVG